MSERAETSGNQGAVDAVVGPRARYRLQVRTEVQDLAWQQIAQSGASGLSLNAIAKRMGITTPALYRYFASRDDLLTELILSAYRDLADLVESAAGSDGAKPARLTAVATAIREWALANPHRYLLLYGTPVPGYSAPAEATELATRIFNPVLTGFSEDSGQTMRQSLSFWTRVHGVISLEVSGHFMGLDCDPAQLFDDEVKSTVEGLS